ncbi:MAG: hypothetical protein J6I46_02885 [Ruminococcus sp.]|nr:hypothetical protein [Ruminococcus sp.]
MNNEQFDAGRRKKNIGTIILVIGIIMILFAIFVISKMNDRQWLEVFAIHHVHPFFTMFLGIIAVIVGGITRGKGSDMQTKAIHNTDVPNNQQQSLNNGQ